MACLYIYIYRERERETYTHIHIYKYKTDLHGFCGPKADSHRAQPVQGHSRSLRRGGSCAAIARISREKGRSVRERERERGREGERERESARVCVCVCVCARLHVYFELLGIISFANAISIRWTRVGIWMSSQSLVPSRHDNDCVLMLWIPFGDHPLTLERYR